MLHEWKLYCNRGERRLPYEIDHGDIDLRCINPDDSRYEWEFDCNRLFRYLQDESDLSYVGLYLSVSSNEPTKDGKRWFLRVPLGDGRSMGITTDLKWYNKNDLLFWDTSFRTYANLYQGRSIVDYSLYVSRSFGYAFMLGQRWDDPDEDDEMQEFINFYPTLHHYHQNVMIDERNFWRGVNDDYPWTPYYYDQPDDDEGSQPSVQIRGQQASTISYDELLRAQANLGQSFSDFAEVLREVDPSNSAEIDMADLLESDEETED